MALHHPADALLAFDEALGAEDEDAARAACTAEGWGAEIEPLRAFFDRLARKGLRLRPDGPPEESGDRALVPARLVKPGEEGPRRPLVLALARGDGGWRLHGWTKVLPLAASFLREGIGLRLRWEDLEPCLELERWGRGLLDALQQAQPSLLGQLATGSREAEQALRRLELLARSGALFELADAVWWPPARRGSVLLRSQADAQGPTENHWLMLDLAQHPPRLTGSSSYPSLEAMLGAWQER